MTSSFHQLFPEIRALQLCTVERRGLHGILLSSKGNPGLPKIGGPSTFRDTARVAAAAVWVVPVPRECWRNPEH
jgi:hypothetical protein